MTPLLHIVLYQPEIHANAGNIGRSCVALGAKLWMIKPLGFKIDDKHLRRAGLDYWKHLDFEVLDDWDSLVERLPEKRPWLFSKTAERLYTSAEFAAGDVLVFGSESRGLPAGLCAAHAERCLRIPMRSQVRCLNLAVSVGIAAYEAVRQFSPGGYVPEAERIAAKAKS